MSRDLPVSERPRGPAVWRTAALFVCAGLAALGAPAAAQSEGAAVDVFDYRFELELSDTTDEIEGRATIMLRVLRRTSEIGFDLDDVNPADDGSARGSGMEVSAVLSVDTAGGRRQTSGRRAAEPAVEAEAAPSESSRSLAFEQVDDRLLVRPVSAVEPGSVGLLEIHYRGVPADGLTIGSNRHGDRTFFADNWPDRAHHWLPVVDHPSDKARVAFVVTAPAHYQVVGTGAFVEAVDLGGGLRRTEWQSRVPVATKVMAIGVARFARLREAVVEGVPVETWVYPQDLAAGRHAFEPAVRVLGAFEQRLGDYPYEKLANVQTTTRWGGLENAGNVFYAEDSVYREGGIETLIAHEVAHQWFGDSVTESDWRHVWLSEGLATYLAACHVEWTRGRGRFLEQMESARQRVLEYAARAPESVVVPEVVADPRRLLSPNVYQKAAWILHGLRGELGDETFWNGLRTYYQRFRDRNAETEDFAEVMEQASGRELDWYFDQWLRRPGVPDLEVDWTFDAASSQIELRIRQRGATDYRLGLDVEATPERGGPPVRRRIRVEGPETLAAIPLEERPESVQIDPDRWLLLRTDPNESVQKTD